MSLQRPRSTIRQLVMAGCLLMSVPLLFTTFNTIFKIERLSRDVQTSVTQTTDAVDNSRLLLSATRDLERSAGQYLVLHDDDVFDRYLQQRRQFEAARAAMQASLPGEHPMQAQLRELQGAESQLFEAITTAVEDGVSPEFAADEIALSGLIQDLPQQMNVLVNDTGRSVNTRVDSMIKRLFWQAVLLIPLFLILAAIFTYLVTRPMRSMGRAIRRLGEGHFEEPISVSGPRDIQELGERLEWLRQRLTELDEQKLTFLHHVSHELKTPLTSIREGVGLLEEEVVGHLNPEQKKVANILKENALQLQEEVEALLNYNSAIAGAEGSLENLELSTLVQETATQQRLAARARGIRFAMTMEKIVVTGDWQQLRILVGNLLSNAIKYSPDQGIIELKLGALKNKAVLDVIDQGPGIAEKDRARIFEPFYQGERASLGHIKGTGLGLAIAYQYAKANRGELELLPSDEGAHFRLTLPQYLSGD